MVQCGLEFPVLLVHRTQFAPLVQSISQFLWSCVEISLAQPVEDGEKEEKDDEKKGKEWRRKGEIEGGKYVFEVHL